MYVARELEKLRPMDFGTNERVFKRGMPDMDTFRKDLAAAGIQYIDKQGRFADFHALRMTFSTLVALVRKLRKNPNGVEPALRPAIDSAHLH